MMHFAVCFLFVILFLSLPTDEFDDAVMASREEHAAGRSPVWVGEFMSSISCDRVGHFFVSKSKGVAFFESGVFGERERIVVPFEERNGELVLDRRFVPSNPSILPKAFLVATYDEHVFLVPSGYIHGFCLDMRESPSRRCELYINNLRPMERVSKNGKLSIPAGYLVYKDLPELHALVAKVSTIGESTNEVNVTLDIGTANNVYVGMQFENEHGCPFEIIETHDRSSIARVKSLAARTEIEIGMKVRTARLSL